MGKSVAGPRVRASIGCLAVVSGAIGIAGCAHRDVVDTPVGWWHQLEGGEIAQQRPPPPGVNDPYPFVGTTPAKAPEVPSLDLRRSVTSDLLRQRNLTTRLDANNPMPTVVALPPPKPAPGSAAGAAPGGSSASLDAAVGQPKPAASAAASQDSEPELALPPVQVRSAVTGGTVVTLPAIPGAPPPPPHLPGVARVSGVPASDAVPDYAVAPAAGTLIAFNPGTDTMLSGQTGVLHAVAARRGGGSMLVRGYGDCASSAPEIQAQALTVASLRARAVAEALQSEGVPESSILLRADAFGRGASVSLVQ